MILGVVKERETNEKRVALTPETAGRLKAKGFDILLESGAGLSSAIGDEAYREKGVGIIEASDEVLSKADIVAKVQPPTQEEIERMKEGASLVSMLKPFGNQAFLEKLAKRGISAFSLEMLPRITRAQSMDVLSSQANLAGYKAVLMAANRYRGLFPMLMTAAGTVRSARVLVLGVGVAGLQAIATAKRLGAIVSAFDIRPEVKDQVKSLGGKFVELDIGIDDGAGEGGYARELTAEERERQMEALGKVIEKQDIVITTAAIPGRPAPKLIKAESVHGMKPGSVIVDLAAETGGNCELTKPGDTIEESGVVIVGEGNIPSLVATEASNLFARNVMNFLFNLLDEAGKFGINREDEIIAGSLITTGGEIVHPRFQPEQT